MPGDHAASAYDCLAMSEPDAGSDVRSMTTRAVRDGDDYVIDGTKHFISHADKCRLRDPVRRDRQRGESAAARSS